jgi:hypothetical protein
MPEALPGPISLAYTEGIQHERTRIVAMLGHRVLELRGITDPECVGARQELIRLMALVQDPEAAG